MLGVEQFLAGALRQFSDLSGERGDDQGADNARADATINQVLRACRLRVAAAIMPMINAASRVSRNTIMAEPSTTNYSAMTAPRAVFGLKSPKKG